jgi:hypothetical protein
MKVVPSSSMALVESKDAIEFAGGCSMNTPIFFQAPPKGLFENKKLFLFAKRPLTWPRGHPAHPMGGRCGAPIVRRGIPPVGRARGSPPPI